MQALLVNRETRGGVARVCGCRCNLVHENCIRMLAFPSQCLGIALHLILILFTCVLAHASATAVCVAGLRVHECCTLAMVKASMIKPVRMLTPMVLHRA